MAKMQRKTADNKSSSPERFFPLSKLIGSSPKNGDFITRQSQVWKVSSRLVDIRLIAAPVTEKKKTRHPSKISVSPVYWWTIYIIPIELV